MFIKGAYPVQVQLACRKRNNTLVNTSKHNFSKSGEEKDLMWTLIQEGAEAHVE